MDTGKRGTKAQSGLVREHMCYWETGLGVQQGWVMAPRAACSATTAVETGALAAASWGQWRPGRDPAKGGLALVGAA